MAAVNKKAKEKQLGTGTNQFVYINIGAGPPPQVLACSAGFSSSPEQQT